MVENDGPVSETFLTVRVISNFFDSFLGLYIILYIYYLIFHLYFAYLRWNYTKTRWLKQSLIVLITSYNVVLLMLIWSKKCWGCQGIQSSLSFLSFSQKYLNWHVFSLCNGLSWRVLLLLHWLLKFLLKIGEMNSSPNIVPSFLELLRVLLRF